MEEEIRLSSKSKVFDRNIDSIKLLDANSILVSEFEYAAQTAFQANEDRVRLFNFLVANILTYAATIIIPFFNKEIPISIFGFTFFLLYLIGIFSFAQMCRLRTAWLDSIKTMNQIKEFYIHELQTLNLGKAFRWRFDTIPKAQKKTSIAFFIFLAIGFINLVSISMATYLSLQIDIRIKAVLIIYLIILTALVQILMWKKLLKD